MGAISLNLAAQVLNYASLSTDPIKGGSNRAAQWYYNSGDGAAVS